MSKDHTPSGFDRPSGYKSDLEIGETMPNTTKVNTSFGGRQHNAYTMQKDGTHEHYYYNPKQQRSGYHGANYPTHHNHPQLQNNISEKSKGEVKMERSNSFIDSIKVDKATVDRCNNVSRNAAQKANVQSAKYMADDGGRERGDSGPGSLGRESGNKSSGQSGHEGANSGQGSSGHGASGQGSGGQGNGGQGSGGQGCGGQGSGGHGGSGGGH